MIRARAAAPPAGSQDLMRDLRILRYLGTSTLIILIPCVHCSDCSRLALLRGAGHLQRSPDVALVRAFACQLRLNTPGEPLALQHNMPVHIRPFEQRDLHSLRRLWNATVVPALPQCHEITDQELLQEVFVPSQAAAPPGGSGPEVAGGEDPSAAAGFAQHIGQHSRLEHRAVLVAVGDHGSTSVEGDTETLIGWVDCGIDPAHAGTGRQSLGRPAVQFPRRGMIRWLWVAAGRRRAGEALISAAEAHLTQHMDAGGTEDILAFDDAHTYRFYHIGHAYLSDRANHIHALLESRGYRRYESELFYAWRDFTVDRKDVDDAKSKCRVETVDGHGGRPIEISFEAVPGQGQRQNGILRLLRAAGDSGVDGCREQAPEELLGICECVSAGERSSHSDSQDWFLISWLGVPPNPRSGSNNSYANHPSQGQGLGKLALAAAMYYMRHELGYTHAAISTRGIATDLTGPDDTNSRAQLFYSNFGGFAVEDFTYGLRRQGVAAASSGAASL